jgi:hypothetical protein
VERVTLARFVQPEKAEFPTPVTWLGSGILVILVQPVKELVPRAKAVPPLVMVTLVRPVQPENALVPVLVTLEGMVMLVMAVRDKNALAVIDVTL